MEKFGFPELLERMENTYGFKIRSVNTDRHIQIQAFHEKVRPDIIHQFDIWHVSKSINKKLSRKKVREMRKIGQMVQIYHKSFLVVL